MTGISRSHPVTFGLAPGIQRNEGETPSLLLLMMKAYRTFFWIPPEPGCPAEGGTTAFGENDREENHFQ